MKPNLIILSNNFPNHPLSSESWLADEMVYTHPYFSKITVVPDAFSSTHITVPENCVVYNTTAENTLNLNLKEKLNCLKIVWSDFNQYPDKAQFFKFFRYNFALVKNLHKKAKAIHSNLKGNSSQTVVYAYWADNLATTACIMAQMYGGYKVIARGHGFEIFEEQTKNNVIPFRKFQYKYLTHLFADSQKGLKHLESKSATPKNVCSYSYVGTKDAGMATFDPAREFSIATCSFIRDIKRLHLLPEILTHIDFELTWHVLGDGPDLEKIKLLNKSLPKNIKVIYHGLLNNTEIFNFYKNNSVNLFVSLSYSEGLPVTMMEALSFGIPILSTDVGGCNEICNENTGLLIDRDFDAKEVALNIKKFKESDKNSSPFRNLCRSYWELNFKAEENYKRFAKIISAL